MDELTTIVGSDTPRSATSKRAGGSVPTLVLTPNEAAIALGVSRDFFDDYIRHELKIIRRGSRVMVPICSLHEWIGRTAARPLDCER